jgi:hypothetical protein
LNQTSIIVLDFFSQFLQDTAFGITIIPPAPGVNVMITIFFPIFGEEIGIFLIVIISLDSSNMRQKRQFFRRIFRQDYFKTLTPDQMYIQPRPPFLPV